MDARRNQFRPASKENNGNFNYLVEFMRTLVTYAFNFTDMVGFPSYGVAIIIITVIIKSNFKAPLTVKQIKSMKAMQELQPRMKELQEKYKTTLNVYKLRWAMYKEMGVNPLAGCLPLLVQMPFLIAIFYALQGYPYNPEFEHFLWLP